VRAAARVARTAASADGLRRARAARAFTRSAPAQTITPIPLFSDNYAYLVLNSAALTAVLVDAADARACLAAVPAGYELAGALTTHHHADHAGGNAALAAARPGLPIVGGAAEGGRVPAATRLVAGGEAFELGGVAFRALHTPGHTAGHVCYLTEADAGAPPALFSGDTLFGAGCGRLFEGDAREMRASLAALAALPPATRVYFGHEYTVANLRFALAVDGAHAPTAARARAAAAARAAGAPTAPSTIAEEVATNPFLRTRDAAVRAFTHAALPAAARAALTDEDVLAALREAKNAFK